MDQRLQQAEEASLTETTAVSTTLPTADPERPVRGYTQNASSFPSLCTPQKQEHSCHKGFIPASCMQSCSVHKFKTSSRFCKRNVPLLLDMFCCQDQRLCPLPLQCVLGPLPKTRPTGMHPHLLTQASWRQEPFSFDLFPLSRLRFGSFLDVSDTPLSWSPLLDLNRE